MRAYTLVCSKCGLSHPKGAITCQDAKEEMRRRREKAKVDAIRRKRKSGSLRYLGKEMLIPY